MLPATKPYVVMPPQGGRWRRWHWAIRSVVCLGASVVCLSAAGRSAHARDMTGKGGIGVMVNSEGMPLATLRYWGTTTATEVLVGWVGHKRTEPAIGVRDGAVVQGATGEATASAREACLDAAANADPAAGSTVQCSSSLDLSHLRVSLGLLVRLHDAPRATLSLGIRPWLQFSNQTSTLTTSIQFADGTSSPATSRPDVTGLPLMWGVELPLMAEAFLSDHISLIGQFAVGIGQGRHPEYARDAIAARTTAADWWLASGGTFSGGAGLSYYF